LTAFKKKKKVSHEFDDFLIKSLVAVLDEQFDRAIETKKYESNRKSIQTNKMANFDRSKKRRFISTNVIALGG